MRDEGERVHRFPVEQHVQLDEVRLPVSDHFIVQGGVPLGLGLQTVIEIQDDFVER